MRFPNIFVDYPLGQMHVGDKLWTNWNKAPMRLWQAQLNFTVWCTLSACGVSSAHLNYTKHPMIRSVYRFHIYYHVRRVLKRLQVPLPHETGFNAADNPHTESEFLEICEDYRVPNDHMRYRDEKVCWTYQCSIGWPDDYLGPDSMTQWIIEKSDGFTDIGLYRISEGVRTYAYLILSSQASARSGIVGNTASVLTAQSAFLNNFEDIVNQRVDIREDIKHYQDTLSYTSSKVDYSVGKNLYMLPSNMQFKIKTGTVRYNNKILVSDGKFILGENEKVNEMPRISHRSTITHHELEKKPNITQAQKPSITHHELAKEPTHEDEKIVLVFALAGGFAIWNVFQ